MEASDAGGGSSSLRMVSTKNQLVEVHVSLPLPSRLSPPRLEQPVQLECPYSRLSYGAEETSPLTSTAVLAAQSADGLFDTPRNILLSGSGPKDELAQVGVESTFDLGHIGKHLTDHSLVLMYYNVNSNTTFDDTEDKRMGLFSTMSTNVVGFMRIPQGEGANDSSYGPRSAYSAHIDLLFANGFAALGNTKQPDEGHFLTVIAAVVSPKSEGSLTLASAEGGTFTYPNIDYGLLTNEFDLVAIQQALRDADTFLNATPWTSPSPYIIAPFTRDGTAKMSYESDLTGVTDSRLRVKGIEGVKVVDASIFPSTTECHPQGQVYTVGEKGAQLIKEDNRLA
ncbi:hypothetical protein K435DRAFT_942407 [Dendrothele bispora CBS 962.96]|uniref:Glucose-methanol-choline oxidoreductase C-terminal domain-containing protein n=1 Tax=Dendrothele bispora (strain CBS 962.96) TaxID=1314807 RepID=A0A4S8KV42_DENBC|nr:hypothetical protein K435DRAFT_942407 [Dendrothele bispora CBS 962.96]